MIRDTDQAMSEELGSAIGELLADLKREIHVKIEAHDSDLRNKQGDLFSKVDLMRETVQRTVTELDRTRQDVGTTREHILEITGLRNEKFQDQLTQRFEALLGQHGEQSTTVNERLESFKKTIDQLVADIKALSQDDGSTEELIESKVHEATLEMQELIISMREDFSKQIASITSQIREDFSPIGHTQDELVDKVADLDKNTHSKIKSFLDQISEIDAKSEEKHAALEAMIQHSQDGTLEELNQLSLRIDENFSQHVEQFKSELESLSIKLDEQRTKHEEFKSSIDKYTADVSARFDDVHERINEHSEEFRGGIKQTESALSELDSRVVDKDEYSNDQSVAANRMSVLEVGHKEFVEKTTETLNEHEVALDEYKNEARESIENLGSDYVRKQAFANEIESSEVRIEGLENKVDRVTSEHTDTLLVHENELQQQEAKFDEQVSRLDAKIEDGLETQTADVAAQKLKLADAEKSINARVSKVEELSGEHFLKTKHEIEMLSTQVLEKYASVEAWQRGGPKYKKFSFVRHNGGLWQAQKSTEQEPGDGSAWMLVSDGVAYTISEFIEDAVPTVKLGVRLASGYESTAFIRLPEYRDTGAFEKEKNYKSGDLFRKDRNTFAVVGAGTIEDPYESPNCFLMAMGGARGSRGAKGERGPMGPQGPAGNEVTSEDVKALIEKVLAGRDGIPVRSYRGSWKYGETYYRGDIISLPNSAWIASEDNNGSTSPTARDTDRVWLPILTVDASGSVTFEGSGESFMPFDPAVTYLPFDIVTYPALRTTGITGRQPYELIYQNRTGNTVGPAPWTPSHWTELGFIESDIEAIIRVYDNTRGYRTNEKVIYDISSSDSTPIIYMALMDADPKAWDWGDVGTVWQPLNATEGAAGSRIEYWQPNTEYAADTVVAAIDPAAPIRDWVQLWRNEQGIPIAGTPEFYAPSWQLLGAKKQDIEYRILDYDDAATYPQDDKVVHESSLGAGNNIIWRCTNVNKPPGAWNPVDWEPLSIVEHENLRNRNDPDQHSIGAITGLTQELLEAENHRDDAGIHFNDAPVGGAGFIRRNNQWVFATNIAALIGQPSSATLGTGGFDLVSWDAELEHGLMGDNADPATGIINIPEDSFYRLSAHVFGTQGNSTKEESMWLEYEVIGGGNAGIYPISHLEIGTDKTSDRSLSAQLTLQLLSANSLRLRLRASAGLGTFSFTYCSFEVLKLV